MSRDTPHNATNVALTNTAPIAYILQKVSPYWCGIASKAWEERYCTRRLQVSTAGATFMQRSRRRRRRFAICIFRLIDFSLNVIYATRRELGRRRTDGLVDISDPRRVDELIIHERGWSRDRDLDNFIRPETIADGFLVGCRARDFNRKWIIFNYECKQRWLDRPRTWHLCEQAPSELVRYGVWFEQCSVRRSRPWGHPGWQQFSQLTWWMILLHSTVLAVNNLNKNVWHFLSHYFRLGVESFQ